MGEFRRAEAAGELDVPGGIVPSEEQLAWGIGSVDPDYSGPLGFDDLIEQLFAKPATPVRTTWTLGPRPVGPGNSYARKALADEMAALAAMAVDSGRNHACNVAAFNLGQLVAAGELDESEVRWRLLEAMRVNRYCETDGQRAAEATIASGLAAGRANPRAPRRAFDALRGGSWQANPRRGAIPPIRVVGHG